MQRRAGVMVWCLRVLWKTKRQGTRAKLTSGLFQTRTRYELLVILSKHKQKTKLCFIPLQWLWPTPKCRAWCGNRAAGGNLPNVFNARLPRLAFRLIWRESQSNLWHHILTYTCIHVGWIFTMQPWQQHASNPAFFSRLLLQRWQDTEYIYSM